MNRRMMAKRVVNLKIAQIEREGGALKDFFKGIIYEDYEIAIQNLVDKSILTIGDLNLVPFRQVPNTIKVKPDEIFVDGKGTKYVVALNESTPLIGVSLLMNAGELLNKDKHSRLLFKIMNDKGLQVYSTRELRSKLENKGFAKYLVG